MREFDEIGLKLCRLQGEAFSVSVEKVGCGSGIFVRRFMNSEAASRLDHSGTVFEICDAHSILEEIEREYGPSDYGKEKYSPEVLYWMGYLYRYWCYTGEKTSKQVYRIVKPKELRQLYYPYHSLDPAHAIERILEAREMDQEDQIRRGVEILRRRLRENPET